MLRILRHPSQVRLIALWAVALALALKMLVPAGTMPIADSQGVRITLCTGAGAVETVLDLGGKQHQQDEGKAAHQPCAFAALGMDVLGGNDAVPPLPTIPASAAMVTLPPLPARAPPPAALPPATGPPFLI